MTEVTKLMASFDRSGIQRYSLEHMIPLVVPKSSILDVETLPSQLGSSGKPPVLKFVPGTMTIKLAGGQHRLAALKKYRTTFQEKGQEAERLLQAEIRAKDDSQQSRNRIAHWRSESSRIAAELEEYGFWGVAVYDESEFSPYQCSHKGF
jgi:hypothetical protein